MKAPKEWTIGQLGYGVWLDASNEPRGYVELSVGSFEKLVKEVQEDARKDLLVDIARLCKQLRKAIEDPE